MYLLKHKDDTVAVIEIFGSDASCIRVNDIVNHHLLPLCAQHDYRALVEEKGSTGFTVGYKAASE